MVIRRKYKNRFYKVSILYHIHTIFRNKNQEDDNSTTVNNKDIHKNTKANYTFDLTKKCNEFDHIIDCRKPENDEFMDYSI